ncbi:integrase core domain-containing protein [Nitrosospira sp. Nsp11]|uniref:integrase core domain-containing protein n=1 Tax=Nitrosospira sp. Nsp11 TaxID=1855338 RepID=UPI0009325207
MHGLVSWCEALIHSARKLTQNLYIESFNGRFRDECLNDHWFLTWERARILIEFWWKDTIQIGCTVRWVISHPRVHDSHHQFVN